MLLDQKMMFLFETFTGSNTILQDPKRSYAILRDLVNQGNCFIGGRFSLLRKDANLPLTACFRFIYNLSLLSL